MSDLAVADLARSGISANQAVTLGMFSVTSAATDTCFREFRAQPALVIPYFDIRGDQLWFERDGTRLPFGRVRYLGSTPQKLGFQGPRDLGKYGQPARSGIHAYFPPGINWAAVAADPRQPLLLAEGEKKAAKLCLEGFNAIGIGGCWNFRTDGGLEGLKLLMPELEQFVWQGRSVYLAIDGDAATNPQIAAAECRLALELGLRRGASVYRIRFPAAADGSRMGADDYLVAYGADAFEQLAAKAEKMREADAHVADLNQKHAVICVGGKTFVADFAYDAALERRKINYFTPKDFAVALANRFVADPNDPRKQAPLSSVWLKHPHRRQYLGGVTLAPMQDVPEGVFNLWRGFSVEPKKGDWSLFRSHILDNVCAGAPALFDYMLNWMARLVQHPGEPGQVAIVMRGGRGVGKGKVACWIGRMMNDHFIQATQADHVTGKFNGHLQDCVVLFGDEAFFAGNPAHEKILNGLITETTRLSEQKFLNAVTVRNYIHLILSTNSEWAIPAGMDERRYLVLDVPDHIHKQDSPYFAAIDAQMESGGLAAMLFDLQQRDISKFEVRRVPQTAGLADQKRRTLHARGGALAWLQDILTAGEVKYIGEVKTTVAWSAKGLQVSRNELFDAYEAWERNRPGRAHPESREAFGRRLKAVLGASFKGGDNTKLPKAVNAERPRAYFFAPLDQCRLAFMASQNMPGLWRADDE
ncbi:MAG: DUF3854 domain-containing protein [Alphaproteobacteria bacterium]|nr:DUF3854 domain-containing protein [Alphaproteobacteria bacterium]